MTDAKSLKNIFNRFNKLKVAIVGDSMLDKYVHGVVERISPEAPVPVLDVKETVSRSGGAANVAMNVQALGATAYLFSLVGKDADGDNLMQILKQNATSKKHIYRTENRITTTKTRIISKNHQMLRIDNEVTDDIDNVIEKHIIRSITNFIKKEKPHVLIFEDYDKGMLSPFLIQSITELCIQNKIPVVVDPKKLHFFDYQNCTVFKPNLREISESLNMEIIPNNVQELNQAADILFAKLNNTITLITLGEHGIFLREGKKSFRKKAHLRKIADVSGAGDTVISTAALCLAAKAEPQLMAAIANIAGGLVCETSGVVPINKQQLFDECLMLLC